MKFALLLCGFSVMALGQFSSTAHHIGPYASAPAHCSTGSGDIYYNTTSKMPFYCSATDTWTAMGGGGGGASPAGSTGCVQLYGTSTTFACEPLYSVAPDTNGVAIQLNTPNLSSPIGGFGSFQNFLQWTECLDCGVWTFTNAAVDATTFIPPNNDISASGDTSVTSSMAGGYAQQCYDTGVAMTGRTFTYSVWVKVPSGSVTSRMMIVSDTPTTAVSSTVAVTTEWQRVSVTGTFGADAGTQACVRFLPTSTGTGTVFAWGHQLEEGAYASVYVSLENQVQAQRVTGLYASSSDVGSFGFSLGFNTLGDPTSGQCGDCFAFGLANVAKNGSFVIGEVNQGGINNFVFGKFTTTTGTASGTIGFGIGGMPLTNPTDHSLCLAMNTDTCSLIVGDAGGMAGALSPVSVPGIFQARNYTTSTNCADSAGAAACGSAAAGRFVADAAATTVVVSTTAVTANSEIFIEYDSSLSAALSVTCNATIPSAYAVTARTAGTSFTLSTTANVANPGCFSYHIVN